MLQYEFESVNCLAHSYNIFGGFGPEREKLREAIARRAA